MCEFAHIYMSFLLHKWPCVHRAHSMCRWNIDLAPTFASRNHERRARTRIDLSIFSRSSLSIYIWLAVWWSPDAHSLTTYSGPWTEGGKMRLRSLNRRRISNRNGTAQYNCINAGYIARILDAPHTRTCVFLRRFLFWPLYVFWYMFIVYLLFYRSCAKLWPWRWAFEFNCIYFVNITITLSYYVQELHITVTCG